MFFSTIIRASRRNTSMRACNKPACVLCVRSIVILWVGEGRNKLRLSGRVNELDLRRKTKICLAPNNIVFGNPTRKNSIEIRLPLAKRVPRKTRVETFIILRSQLYCSIENNKNGMSTILQSVFQPSNYSSENRCPQ